MVSHPTTACPFQLIQSVSADEGSLATFEIMAGIAYEQCGKWKLAQNEYYNLMVQMQQED